VNLVLKIPIGFKYLKWLALTALSAASAGAGTLTFSVSGTFDGAAPTTTYTAPNEAWSLTFQVANPPLAGPGVGGFQTTYNNISYILNGASVSTTGVNLDITSNGVVNAVDVFLDTGSTQLVVYTFVSIYSGSNTNPTLIPSNYATQNGELLAGTAANFATLSTLDITGGSAVPEPKSGLLAFTGLAVVGLLNIRLRRRMAQRT